MGNCATVGIFPPSISRYWRNLAHFRPASRSPFLRDEKACNRTIAASLPQVICGVVYHFRTPSPGGQRISKDVMLPTFFLRPCHNTGCDVTACCPSRTPELQTAQLRPRARNAICGNLFWIVASGHAPWRSRQLCHRQHIPARRAVSDHMRTTTLSHGSVSVRVPRLKEARPHV